MLIQDIYLRARYKRLPSRTWEATLRDYPYKGVGWTRRKAVEQLVDEMVAHGEISIPNGADVQTKGGRAKLYWKADTMSYWIAPVKK